MMNKSDSMINEGKGKALYRYTLQIRCEPYQFNDEREFRLLGEFELNFHRPELAFPENHY